MTPTTINTDIFHPPLPTIPGKPLPWQNLHGASIALALSNAIAQSQQPVLLIAPDSLSAANLITELNFFAPEIPVLSLPHWETLPYDHFSPHQDITSERLAALYRIPTLSQGVIITTAATVIHRLSPRDFLGAHSFLLKRGDQLNIEHFRNHLTKSGYYAVSQVRSPGEFAIRGSIIDLFPMGSHTPFRIDLLDDEVDSIRLFSAETQRSLEKINEIRLLPAKEFPLSEAAIEQFRQNWRSQFSGNPLKCPIYQDISEGICPPGIEYYLSFFFTSTASLFDYLPANTLILTLGNIHAKITEFWQEITLRYEQLRFDQSRPLLQPEQLFIPVNACMAALKNYLRITCDLSTLPASTPPATGQFTTAPAPTLEVQHKAAHPLAALNQFITDYSGRILFCAESAGRREVLLQLFNSIALTPTYFPSWQAFITSDEPYGITVTPIEQGFLLENPPLAIITETQLYGQRVMQRRLRKKTPQDTDALVRDLSELQIGDAVVHLTHGVGRYCGLQTLTISDQIAEFLCLEYQGGDKVYVPVAALHLIARYSGADPEHAPINKLGTDQWQKAKRKAAEKVRDVAAELLELYAKRAAQPGHAHQVVNEQYLAFAAQFPFEETPDQLQAIEQVFNDMTTDKPMDRVVCGDVGFGKTEVALRAAFLAVQNNKQVTLLVPTTLLAQQHFQTFQDRFADWPVVVEMLSRFRTAKEQKQILERLATGRIDILIATHKLLQSDIKFKNLGLVIIDEEHRFGVKQKEKLKALRTTVDMLTLTATPIPRTLNMALAGIRDLSIIATAPSRRLSVKTFVHEYQEGLTQEAIQREIMRGGQVYFLHNEVANIHKKAEEIAALVPEARIGIAHGQMHERDLERAMSEFYHRHHNVLVCSTIIESGIDIPTANTIIINRADKFGLAQLHQLRGRVGRSHHQAYAYLLTPPRQQMTANAVKRLDAIASLADLGIGFTLATHDLEIRGAGELLGEEQSGDMHAVGFTLYMDLLTRAVEALKAGKPVDLETSLLPHTAEVDLRISALIPDTYLVDVPLRLQFYKHIANAQTEAALNEIQVTMIDRFGLLPESLKNLFVLSELRIKADGLGITKIEATDKTGKLEFNDKPNINPATIIRLIQAEKNIVMPGMSQFRLDGPTRLRFTLLPHEAKTRIALIDHLLTRLAT